VAIQLLGSLAELLLILIFIFAILGIAVSRLTSIMLILIAVLSIVGVVLLAAGG